MLLLPRLSTAAKSASIDTAFGLFTTGIDDDVVSFADATEWLKVSLSALTDVDLCPSFLLSDPDTFCTDIAFSPTAPTTDGIFPVSSGLEEAAVGVASGLTALSPSLEFSLGSAGRRMASLWVTEAAVPVSSSLTPRELCGFMFIEFGLDGMTQDFILSIVGSVGSNNTTDATAPTLPDSNSIAISQFETPSPIILY